ncbi:MAG: hypothetical protein H7Y31_01750 [Chitinophagaceae bacterium]|nr:hypothetical protein [Chitinophagaceae bacterium]
MKKIVLVLLIASGVGAISMRFSEQKFNSKRVIESIQSLYHKNVYSLDSFLQTYSSYFYDSSYLVRDKKLQELTYSFKKATCFFHYFEPELYYEHMSAPFQFNRKPIVKNRYGVLPSHFLISGAVGNEPDSVLRKRKKQDSLDAMEFINVASMNIRLALSNTELVEHFEQMDATVLFDALRMEIFRISTIDIANADFIVEVAGMSSIHGSMNAWLEYMDLLMSEVPDSKSALHSKWKELSNRTSKYLNEHNEFHSFERVLFLKTSLVPLSAFLKEVQQELNIPFVSKFAAIQSDAAHMYDENILNADFFAKNEKGNYSTEKAKLGELLFYDPILSGNNQRSCASCHNPNLGYADGLAKSISFEKTSLPRNSPTLINAGFQKKQFWDLRASSLEDQLDSVVNNPHELNSSFEEIIKKINSSPEYVARFNKAFPATKTNGIEREDVKNAIGVFERTLVGLNSRFDKYMRGDETKLTGDEVAGFEIFIGKARCGACHFAPLFGPALPPFFDLTDHHSIGVPEKDSVSSFTIDPDKGVFLSTALPFTKFSFKSPTLRNIAVTGPYMHNGLFADRKRVIDFYNDGAGGKFSRDMRASMGDLPFLTILPFPLKLNDKEKSQLHDFLGSLTDTSAASKIPTALPRLQGKYAMLNHRKIGGEY